MEEFICCVWHADSCSFNMGQGTPYEITQKQESN